MNTDVDKKVSEYIKGEVLYGYGTSIWFNVDKNGGVQKVLDIRGWGHLSTTMGDSEAEKFQDEIGEFVAEAINEKLKKIRNKIQ